MYYVSCLMFLMSMIFRFTTIYIDKIYMSKLYINVQISTTFCVVYNVNIEMYCQNLFLTIEGGGGDPRGRLSENYCPPWKKKTR